MATMKNVAKEAGVSLGTVSNVLNNLPSVSYENRQKVNDAIKKLRFRPNTAARTLKTGTTKSLGLVIPDITNPFYPELARGVEDAAKKWGFTVFLCNNDRDVHKEREYINVLIEKNVDGIILVKPQISLEEIDEIHEKCSIVLVDMYEEIKPLYDVVKVDDYGGSLKAMNLLYEYGHTRIALIKGLMDSQSSKCRYEAYIKFMKDKNLEVDDALIKNGSYDWYSGYTCTVELLRQLNPPTAIFALNDLMAIGVMKAIRERRLNVPFDISVIGYDDIDMASLCTPQLTTVRQPKYELGTVSVEMLVNKLKIPGSTGYAQENTITLETDIILRESVGYVKK